MAPTWPDFWSETATCGVWALALLLLIPARHLLHRLLARSGHGELLILCGMAAAFGGAALFESFQIKGDLGALAMGVLLSGSKKSSELARTLLDLKNLMLVGFFITIGLNGQPDARTFAIAAAFFYAYSVIMTRRMSSTSGGCSRNTSSMNFSSFGNSRSASKLSA